MDAAEIDLSKTLERGQGLWLFNLDLEKIRKLKLDWFQ